ncbi:uncharacterized protein LOC135154813 [Lytechinus pictus]|uniref:uncharacterized protein LOC135154813 n=1 Tax=Lytechinus pictus TaxID=7653 RepID=UPI0030BA1089
MDSANSEIKKRNRNWSDQEIFTVCSFVTEKHQLLFGNSGHCTQTVEERKKKTWEECEQLLLLNHGTSRCWKDIKRKWSDLKIRANKYVVEKNKTGGGPFNLNSVFEAVLDAQCQQAISGIFGNEIEAGLPSSQDTDSETAAAQIFTTMATSVQPSVPSLPSIPVTGIPVRTIATYPSTSRTTQATKKRKVQHNSYEEESLKLKKQRIELEKRKLVLQERCVVALEEIRDMIRQFVEKEC